jgi:hypothetical protein
LSMWYMPSRSVTRETSHSATPFAIGKPISDSPVMHHIAAAFSGFYQQIPSTLLSK